MYNCGARLRHKHFLEAVVMDELVFVRGSDFEEAVDDAIGVDAVAFRGEVDDDTMAEHRLRERADIFERHMRPTVNQGACFRTEN